MSRQLFLTASVFSAIILLSCKHTSGDLAVGGGTGPGSGGTGGISSTPCDPATIYFQQQVLPILVSNCAMSGCHDDASHEDGVVLTSYQKVMATADVRPGNAASSDLYEVITDNDPDDRMPKPPRNPLTAQQIQIIRQWIDQGARDLSCAGGCDSSLFTFSGAILPIIQNKCQGCHSGAAAAAGIDLSTYNGIKTNVTNGTLWGAINHQSGFSPMPQNGTKLSACELNQFEKWIAAGSLNN